MSSPVNSDMNSVYENECLILTPQTKYTIEVDSEYGN